MIKRYDKIRWKLVLNWGFKFYDWLKSLVRCSSLYNKNKGDVVPTEMLYNFDGCIVLVVGEKHKKGECVARIVCCPKTEAGESFVGIVCKDSTKVYLDSEDAAVDGVRTAIRKVASKLPAEWLKDEERLWAIADQDNCEGDCDIEPPHKQCPECLARSVVNECGDIVRDALQQIEIWKAKP